MPKFLNREGKVYGRLTVISHAGKDIRGLHLWECECSCGNIKIVVGQNLSSNKSKSCGCLKNEFLKAKGNQYGLYEDRQDAMLRVQYSHLKRRHTKNKMIGYVIIYETFSRLSKSKCRYCGLEYSKIIEDRLNESKNQKRLSDEILKINGIDRIDSDIGYTKDNSVPCCKYCNFAKHTMSEKDFYIWVKRVYEYNRDRINSVVQ